MGKDGNRNVPDSYWCTPDRPDCLGKKGYSTKQRARGACARLKGQSATPTLLGVFRCPVCNNWHIGNKKGDYSRSKLRYIRKLRARTGGGMPHIQRAEYDRQRTRLEKLRHDLELSIAADARLHVFADVMCALIDELDTRLSELEVSDE